MINNNGEKIRNNVMGKIKRGEVKMRPAAYFALASFLTGFGLAVSAVLAVFFFNLAFFKFRVHSPFEFLRLGQLGFSPFISTFPWLPVTVALLSFLSGMYLIKKYDFSYKKSIVAITIVFFALVAGFGIILDKTGFAERAEGYHYGRKIYRTEFIGRNWLIGKVQRVSGENLGVVTPKSREITVVINAHTRFPSGRDIQPGERVRAVGFWQSDDEFHARGIIRAAGGRGRRYYQGGPRR